jgi:hypothetical protein
VPLGSPVDILHRVRVPADARSGLLALVCAWTSFDFDVYGELQQGVSPFPLAKEPLRVYA